MFYACDVWDPGSESEEFARTSFRSTEEGSEDDSYCNNEDYVASLMRRNPHHQSYSQEDLEMDEEDEDEILEEEDFALPTLAKPLPILAHPSRHSVLNR